MRSLGRSFAVLIFLAASFAPVAAQSAKLPLAGSWQFRLDPNSSGHVDRWFETRFSGEVIDLPGSMDQAGYGKKTETPPSGWLTRPYTYEGAAWYQKEVVIPESWRGQRITLFLERAHWQTEVWVDGRAFGMQNSLSTPHVYDLTAPLAPGTHRITICVDNTLRIDVGDRAHSVTDHTQTNWNGIIGQIELRTSPGVSIESVSLHPDFRTRKLLLRAVLLNSFVAPAYGELAVEIAGLRTLRASRKVSWRVEETFELLIPFGDALRLWDEHAPALYSLELRLNAFLPGRVNVKDALRTTFGLRDIATRGTQFTLNGRPIFLRGTLECALWPLTGYPAMSVEEWERLFRIARSYGLNHFRFHSWCPPEAGFIAADRAGFLLQIELPVWSRTAGKNPALNEFMRAEGHRILSTYGNHPSFMMLSLGNELIGDDKFLDALVAEFKSSDLRRLYTFSSDHRRRLPGPTSEYYITMQTASGRTRLNNTRFGKNNDATDHDLTEAQRAVKVPLITHEMGQWAVHPSYDELTRYTGVLKPHNLEVFRDILASRGMLDQAELFQQASGKFSWRIYKEDIEAAFRTPNYGGFQLLQLEDFSGQGEALVGLLDSFWESKSILTPEEFRKFCNATVPLARFKKFVWTAGETLSARAEVAHYGKKPLQQAAAVWDVKDDTGRVWASGKFPPQNLKLGSVTPVGAIEFPLLAVSRAAHLKLTLRLPGTEALNDWDLWVYPKSASIEPAADVMVTSVFDEAAQRALAGGGKVIFLLPPGQPGANLLPTRFLPVFWSFSFFKDQPGTMGILCNPAHQALGEFPTAMHSDFQWWELMESARAFVLDETPHGFRPVVQVIDDFHRAHKLGAVIEARVGSGKLLAVSLDLRTNLEQRPAARQLLHSLLRYAASDRFNPQQALSAGAVEKLLIPTATGDSKKGNGERTGGN